MSGVYNKTWWTTIVNFNLLKFLEVGERRFLRFKIQRDPVYTHINKHIHPIYNSELYHEYVSTICNIIKSIQINQYGEVYDIGDTKYVEHIINKELYQGMSFDTSDALIKKQVPIFIRRMLYKVYLEQIDVPHPAMMMNIVGSDGYVKLSDYIKKSDDIDFNVDHC